MNYIDLLSKSITPFHAVNEMANILIANGYEELKLNKDWVLKKKHFIVKGGSIIAFNIPDEITGVRITIAHSDSPCLKLKKNHIGKEQHNYYKINSEPYGGVIYSSWLDRPLSLAGRVYYEENGDIKDKLFNIDKNLAIIPNMSIHQNREVNSGYKFNPQIDLQALFSLKEASINNLIEEAHDIPKDSILSIDGFLYSRYRATTFGFNDEFIASPQLDDLACAFSTLSGFIQSKPRELAIWAVFNNEEVGSLSPEGASSPLLRDCLTRILDTLKIRKPEQDIIFGNIKIISADNAHALHPNFPEKSDPLNNCILNKGIVIKHHAGNRYATTAYMSALLIKICTEEKIPYQHFANRNDAQSGGTIGSLISGVLVAEIADVGLPQLAMHSSMETMGKDDFQAMERLICAFLKS